MTDNQSEKSLEQNNHDNDQSDLFSLFSYHFFISYGLELDTRNNSTREK